MMIRSILSVLVLLAADFTLCAQDLNTTDEQGRKQGDWKKLHDNGRVRYEGQFKNDDPVGLFKYYYPDGKLQATHNHLGDGEVAAHMYHPNGKIKAKGLYVEMKKDSLWQFFNNDEILILEEHYRSDTLNGAQRTYYPNGQLGEEMHYRNGLKHGAWKKFYMDGKRWLESSYEDGDLHGAFLTWLETGKPHMKGEYDHGLRIGVWWIYDDSGIVRTQDVYENGVLKYQKYENGEFTEYYPNEIPKSVYNYKSGMRNGKFKEFYNKGEWVREEVPGKMGGPDEITEQLVGTQVKTKGWYYNDELNGKVHHYNEDGSVERVEVWENGELISTIDWEEKQ